MFFLKKLVSQLLFPVPLCLELLLAGLVLLWFTKRQRTGKALVSIGAVLLGLLSHSVVADRLLSPLEARYPPWQPAAAVGTNASEPELKYVAVLSSSPPDPRLPMTSQLGSSGLARTMEGLRVYHAVPGSRLILSIGNPVSAEQFADELLDFVALFGVDRERVDVVQGVNDTEEELNAIQKIVGSSPFVLVTSASHMPRAMALARGRNMNPIAAPTDHRVKRKLWDSPDEFFPDANSLYRSERAVYEYLGLAWAKVRGQGSEVRGQE